MRGKSGQTRRSAREHSSDATIFIMKKFAAMFDLLTATNPSRDCAIGFDVGHG
jgi:hypothetical protein